jgi:hypothetical protein
VPELSTPSGQPELWWWPVWKQFRDHYWAVVDWRVVVALSWYEAREKFHDPAVNPQLAATWRRRGIRTGRIYDGPLI